jgi:hypothetical protein
MPVPELPHRLSAILSADADEYTRLLAADEPANRPGFPGDSFS